MANLPIDGVPKPTQAILIYQFPYPKTKKIQLQSVFRTQDNTTVENLNKTSTIRDDLITSIEANSSNLVIQAAERYLPYLFGFVVAVENNPNLRLNTPLNFSWSSCLTHGSSSKPHYYTCYTYKFEAIMALMVYAIAHINRAFEIMAVTTNDSFEENSKKGAQFLRQAAGILEYISTKELPRWTDMPNERPLEIDSKIITALMDYCTASAQTVSIKKGMTSGTSNSVLAKLAVDVWRKFDTFAATFKALPADDSKNLNAPFKSFISLAQGLAKASAFRFMACDQYAQEKYGNAVAYINVAAASLARVWTPSPGTPLAKYLKEIEDGKDDIAHIQRSYRNENDHIYIQKVPDEASLEVPDPKCLMSPLSWVPPNPVFDKIL